MCALFTWAMRSTGPPVAHRFDPFDRPCAFQFLFGDAGEDMARPFAIDVDVAGDAVTVELRLFGWAALWADQCRDALPQALHAGISLRPGGRLRVVFEPIDCLMWRAAAELPPARVTDACLRLRTPTAVRAGRALVGSPSALYAALPRAQRRPKALRIPHPTSLEVEEQQPAWARANRDVAVRALGRR